MYTKTVLNNGVRIVTERIPHSRTVSVGIWVDVGSRDEHDLNNGCGHFIEHMLFKGTRNRGPQQIAMELDTLGGMANAFTSKENTCYFATVLDNHVERLAELFSDIFLESVFDAEEVDRERHVILQEISMVEDTPDDQIHDLFAAQLWGIHPLGKTVLGSREVLAAMDAQKLKDHVSRCYTPDRILIAAAGNIDHDSFVSLWEKPFARLAPRSHGSQRRLPPSQLPPARRLYTKPLEQVHTVLGTYGLPVTSDKRYIHILLNTILGGNMSSRLFQEVREKRGLAYSIYSFIDAYVDSGFVGVYLGVDRETVNEALAVIRDEIDRLQEEKVAKQELANAKEFAGAGLFLSSESMENRMTRIARNELAFGRYLSLEEVMEGINAVTAKDIKKLAEELFSRELAVAIMGPLETNEVDWDTLN